EAMGELEGGAVPEADGAVLVAGDEPLAVAGEEKGAHPGPLEGARPHGLPRFGVPEDELPRVRGEGTRGGEGLAVGGKGEGGDTHGRVLEPAELPSGDRVPKAHRRGEGLIVLCGERQGPAIGSVGDALHLSPAVAINPAEPVPRGRVNQPDIRVTLISPHSSARVIRDTDEGKGPAVRREVQPACAAAAWAKRTQLLPRCHVPEAGRPVAPGRGEGLAVGREGDGADRVRPVRMSLLCVLGEVVLPPPDLPARLDLPDTRRAIFA